MRLSAIMHIRDQRNSNNFHGHKKIWLIINSKFIRSQQTHRKKSYIIWISKRPLYWESNEREHCKKRHICDILGRTNFFLSYIWHFYDDNCDKTWYHHRCGGILLLWQKIMTENGLFILGGPETQLHDILWAVHDGKNRGISEGEENFGEFPVMVGGRGRAMHEGIARFSRTRTYARVCKALRSIWTRARRWALTEPEQLH